LFEAHAERQTRLVLDWLHSAPAPRFDLIHDMSGSFWQHAETIPIPVLATLHLPRSLYRNVEFSRIPETVSFNCVSQSQMQEFGDLPRMLGVVRNGIAVERFAAAFVPQANREYLLWIGRICEEKGTHTALEVAHSAGEKIIIAGAVYPFLYHQKYFAREVIPRLKRAGSRAKYVQRPSFPEKVELIRHARTVLVTSEVNETSSLVAMEAAACGTPVLALRRGALPEVIAEGITGMLVNDAQEMASALPRATELDAQRCRQYAEEHYPASSMCDEYVGFYERVHPRSAFSA
jgi:glycosyltransferase involved in cell wall biosynthesis